MTSPAAEQAISFFDTPLREITTVECPPDQQVGIYTCGPTVYKDAHVGNMRAYITADLVRRSVDLAGGEVRQVINITDVGHLASDADTGEDKVAAEAQARGMSAWELAQLYEGRFWEDAAALRIAKPEVVAHATDHLDEQIELIRELERAGFTYATRDGIYFDSSKFPEYGDFAKLNLAGQQAGARIGMGDKRNANDFALWKLPPKAGNREMEWDSPWGVGFPGWHIECSAMAIRHLGDSFAIHTGGIDHIPIHHTNEIAQAKAAGYPFAQHWVHTAFLVNEAGDKMSKSTGASSRLPDVLSEYGITADAMRYFYLSNHYRSPLTLSPERITQASTAHDRLLDMATLLLNQAQVEVPTNPSADAERLWTDFQTQIRTDFNTPRALDIVNSVAKAKRVSAGEKSALLARMDQVLGLGIEDSTQAVSLNEQQQALLSARAAARTDKDFAASDRLRATLAEQGLRVIDAPGGAQLVRWTKS